MSDALLVDLYELTMADAYRREGMAARRATFSLFARGLPARRGYLVAAGLDDCLRWLEELRFGPDELVAIERLGAADRAFLEWLEALRFSGAVRAVPEGTIVFGDEPILEVDAPIAEAQLAETFLLNQVTLQTTLATKAARCRHASAGRAVLDFALRRTQGIDAGMKLSRICRLVGLAGTSNVAGADRYGTPVSGTMAHAFVQAHRSERDAFRAIAGVLGPATVLLVDTYDCELGIEHAIEVAAECRDRGVALRGVRLDSGDLGPLAHNARRRLDEAGLDTMRIFVSGNLDEYEMDRLIRTERAPIDGFGVGTALGVSDDAPSLDTVYKLVSLDGRHVRKTSPDKEIWPGPKQVWRAPDGSGDVLALAGEAAPGAGWRPLLVEVMRDGARTSGGRRMLAAAHDHFEREWAWLPAAVRDLTAPAGYPVTPSAALRELAAELDARRSLDEGPA